ncbi:lytic transglycosylase domain-containing protein [Acinetobacter sp. MB5]|uniref:lytic transglycosylase domain-containing protein n=1 Tax=Acinetobacter sp. MB5 TaxID=2069438 RepID=UPI000DD007A1|nr:lytic transglycosylase domain-containing protein [Acinetobacter sp. MB5]
MKILHKIVLISLYCSGSVLWVPSLAYAGRIYTYEDQDGTPLLTNRQQRGKHLKKINVTFYADSNIHSYHNWGGSEASVLPSYSKNKDAFNQLIHQAAQVHGVSEGLIKAVMHTESGFNSNARSPVGAQGLMQLMPATAKRFNVSNPYDPQQNIFGGARYLSVLLKRYSGNTNLALAAYNAGEGNVDKYGGIPPFRETQDYVHRVMSRYNNLYAGGIRLDTIKDNNDTDSAIASASIKNTTNNSSQIFPTRKMNTRKIIQLSDGTFTDIAVRN